MSNLGTADDPQFFQFLELLGKTGSVFPAPDSGARRLARPPMSSYSSFFAYASIAAIVGFHPSPITALAGLFAVMVVANINSGYT